MANSNEMAVNSCVDITVQNVGVPQTYEMVSKLITDTSDDGNTRWVLLSNVPVKTLYVYENGDYLASDDGLYGYDEVIVNVPTEDDDWDDPFDQSWNDEWDGYWEDDDGDSGDDEEEGEKDYCVSGYGEDDDVFYMACKKEEELLVKPFPSYLVIREKDSSIRASVAEAHNKFGGVDTNAGTSIGLLVEVMLNNGEVYDTFDLDDYDSGAVISDEPSVQTAVLALSDGDGRWLLYTNKANGSSKGTVSEVSYNPSKFYASPYWISEFEDFMGQKFHAEHYVVSGAGQEPVSMKMDSYHDGEYYDTLYGTGVDGVHSPDENWKASNY